MGKVERMGSGVRRVKSLMKQAGLKPPVFEADTFFRAIFYRDPEYSLKRVPEKVTVKVPEKVTPNQRAILDACSQNSHVTSGELASIVGISDRKIKANIAKLKAKGLIRRVGPDKGGHWEILS